MNTFEFPGLWHLKFNIDRVAFTVFGIDIFWYGIILAIAFSTAVLLAIRKSRKFGFEPDTILDLVLWAAIPAIICARLYYVAFSWNDFKDYLYEVFNTRNGGLAIYGAIIGALLAAWIFARVKKINVLSLFDFGIPYFVLAQAIGRWGNFVNQEAYGTHTNLPWGMSGTDIIDGPVHPTFLYESLWDLGLFFFLIGFRKRKKLDGEVLSLYFILYGICRFWIEGLRIDSLYWGNFRISQVLSLALVIAFGIIFIIRRIKLRKLAAADIKEDDQPGTSVYSSLLHKIQEEENLCEGKETSAENDGTNTDDTGNDNKKAGE